MNKKSHHGLVSAYWHPGIVLSSRVLLLSAGMAIYWFLFMTVLLGWYKAEFHMLATSTSVLVVVLGKSSGIVEKIMQ